MNIFYLSKRCFNIVGIHSPKQSEHKLNKKNVCVLIGFGLYSVAAILYILTRSESFDESAEAFLGVSVSFGVFILFMVVIWKGPDLFELIENFEKHFAKREYLKFVFFFKISLC